MGRLIATILAPAKVKPEDFDDFVAKFIGQAEALWKDWPIAA